VWHGPMQFRDYYHWNEEILPVEGSDEPFCKYAMVAYAHDGNRLQPVFSLVHTRLLADLTEYLDAGERKIDRWFDRHQWRPVVFAEHNDIFFNVNSPHDLQQVEARLLAD
ncbi:MAG: hypothetical protein VYB24_01495, partial [Pseudomonadota bacterium]|nr:hypothetical protein [Pseudomonadota bacterium]